MENDFKYREVKSSNLKEVAYNHDDKKLRIKFHNGDLYEFSPVTEDGFRSLLNAESIGKHFIKNIKDNPSINTLKL